ncbi:octaprenyl diphosphate synthase [Salinisphaera sp. USBA-960]|uniref:polyprenyl synthetase family protein n=1 Tax=Salinisphaera orenii TaxID=856731 RepID=UPI000DBEA056|nr:octaprenyl diphosphate synthase [Salifodinibacter halophilus]NNC25634.1 octaprenyl diphosphate synthase [Salifodinibacter halophilus]
MNQQSLLESIGDDLSTVDTLIRKRLNSDVALINALGEYIIASGGKRLRPSLVLMTGQLCGANDNAQKLLATIIEFIHTATLLHDDVVDQSTLRRGQQTANMVWGNEASVLTGDFLYTRAFQMMTELRSHAVMEVMAAATNRIAEGEVMQLMAAYDSSVTEDRYLELVDRKTASLFSAGCELSARLAGCNETQCEAMRVYGQQLGMAFQVVDDCLDYGQGNADYGKNAGDDLADGQPTLPLIYALGAVDGQTSARLKSAVENGDANALGEVTTAIESTGAISYTLDLAQQYATAAVRALDAFADRAERDRLVALAESLVDRRH